MVRVAERGMAFGRTLDHATLAQVETICCECVCVCVCVCMCECLYQDSALCPVRLVELTLPLRLLKYLSTTVPTLIN